MKIRIRKQNRRREEEEDDKIKMVLAVRMNGVMGVELKVTEMTSSFVFVHFNHRSVSPVNYESVTVSHLFLVTPTSRASGLS